jgi:hypothetical protein
VTIAVTRAPDAMTAPVISASDVDRYVVVAIRDADEDRAVAQWVADDAGGQDHVHVVHVQAPLSLLDCDWAPVRAHHESRVVQARRTVARGECPIRAVHAAVELDGSALGGDPAEILTELARLVDVVVIGAPAAGRDDRVGVHLRAAAGCVVVTVPRGYSSAAAPGTDSVTVILDELDLPDALLDFALSVAVRHQAMVRVVRLRSALRHPENHPAELLAQDQFDLDQGLLDRAAAHPELGIVGEISLDGDGATMQRALATSRLVVVAPSLADAAVARLGTAACPIAVVPGNAPVDARATNGTR